MQLHTALRDPAPVARTGAGAALPAPGEAPDPASVDLIRRWLDLSELERRAFLALARELTVSSDLVETSTLDLSARFQTLATIAQAQMGRVDTIVTIAKTIEVGGEPVPVDAAMRSVEEVLRKVIETILSVSKHAMRMVYALDDVSRDVNGAGECVAQIEAINMQTRYLALNAAIEATRSGEAGGAFRVIAREIKELSKSTEDMSKQVRDRIASISTGVRNGHAVLQEIATLDMSEHIMAKDRLDALVGGLIAQNRAFTSVLETTAESSAEMARTIGQLITGMQFQDRTKQHIGQVVDALGVLAEATSSMQETSRAQFPGAFEVGAIDGDWLARLLERQTLGAVKQRILTRLLTEGDPDGRSPSDGDAPASAADDGGERGGEIELF